MKIKTIVILFLILNITIDAQDKIVKLNPPELDKGFLVMQAFKMRASASEFDTTKLSLQDISNLLWAANGINRPESKKRTAPSARNVKDIDVYICIEEGVFFYDPDNHSIVLIREGDYRSIVSNTQPNMAKAPLFCILVSDFSRFPSSTDSNKNFWATADAGIVSQNISIFCSGMNFLTRPRAQMDHNKLHELLKLKKSQRLILNHPVSYRKRN